MTLYAKRIISRSEAEKKILNNVIDYTYLITQHTVVPYNSFIAGLKSFYESKSILIYSVTEDEELIEYYLEFGKFELDKPMLDYANGQHTDLTPWSAVVKQASYLVHLHADLKWIEVVRDKTTKTESSRKLKYTLKNKRIGSIPVMRGSAIDPTPLEDENMMGYFILKGTEKIILSIEEIRENVLLIDKSETSIEVYIYSASNGYRYNNRLIKNFKKPLIYRFQPLNLPVCPFALLKILGYTDADIINKVCDLDDPVNVLMMSSWIQHSNMDRSKEAAISMIASALSIPLDETSEQKIIHMVTNYILLHVGSTSDSIKLKGEFIIGMLKKLSELMNKTTNQSTLVDELEYKQIKLPGVLIEELFKYAFYKQIEQFKSVIIKNISNKSLNLLNLFRAEVLTNGLSSPIISGTWIGNKQNITTTIDRVNKYAYYSVLRKITSPLLKTQAHISARSIAGGYRGRIDPVDSGHGEVIGLVKSLALGAIVTVSSPFHILKKLKTGSIPLYLNSTYFATLASVTDFVTQFKAAKNAGVFSRFVNFNCTPDRIDVRSDGGRITRILYTQKVRNVETEQLANYTLTELEKKGYVEWLDCLEQKDAVIAQSKADLTATDTHAEIDPILLFNITSASIPFLNNTGPARISYGQKLFKQAIVGKTYKHVQEQIPLLKRVVNNYVQKPLVGSTLQSKIEQIMKGVYTGVNITICIMAYGGWNLEDASVVNKASMQRGLFKSYVYKTTTVETDNKSINNYNGFVLPVGIEKSKLDEAYALLDTDGLALPNTTLKRGDALVSRYNLPRYAESMMSIDKPTYKDNTVFNLEEDIDVVDVLVSRSPTLTSLAYVTTCSTRPTEIGDKLTSRFAQKGVIGRVDEPWNLPYDRTTGIAPDILIAGSAYPTRFTLGHILEILVGKACAQNLVYAENFFSNTFDSLETVFKTLESTGLGYYSDQTLVNPKTGLDYKCKVFTGVSYYLKLHHLAKDKLHIRSTGPVQLLTRQATEGKSHTGGLRLGEMERDCILTYGAANLILERLNIDLMTYLVCSTCNELVDVIYHRKQICKLCKTTDNLHRIKLPHAFKLLIDELNALHIKVNIFVKKYE